jgi:branched-chain amino acid transport system substrate-binding protein
MTIRLGNRPGARPLRRALLLAALATAACGGPGDPAEERVERARSGRGDILIAAAWPWELRKEIRYGEGLEMAVDEANAAGGISGRKLKIVRFDDQETIDQGGIVAQQIASNPDIVAVVGHLQSYITVQAANVYDQAGLVLVAPTATDPDLTQRGYERVFRATFNDKSVGRQLADFVAGQDLKRVAIYYIRNAYGRNVANAFEARAARVGLSVVARSSYDPSEQANERTFEATLRELKVTEMDAIVLPGEVPSAAIFIAQARAHGITVPIVGGDAMSSPGLMAVAGPASEGVMVASFFHPAEPRPEIPAFDAAFRKKYGVAPDAGSALGYDCVRLLIEGMRRAKTPEPDAVARELRGLRDWRGVTGTFTFDENGDIPGKPIVVSTVKDGQFAYQATLGPARQPGGRP